MKKIIIDVLRSSSTIVAAFYSGVESIKPVLRPSEGLELKNEGYITVGEYKGKPLEGYDFQNSPSQMLDLDLRGKKIALCTTNGSGRIIESPNSYIGCFMNAKFVANLDAIPYPVGRLGSHAIEDDLCALVITAERYDINVDIEKIKDSITKKFNDYVTKEGRAIPKRDLDICLTFNEFPILPYYNGHDIRKL
jgi:2-phosphosulfolactate phosphatase